MTGANLVEGNFNLDVGQFHRYVVRPVLRELDMGGLAAERLVIGTCLAESRLKYIDQIEAGGDKKPGPAFGLPQMEKRTNDDHWLTWLAFRPEVARSVKKFMIADMGAEQMQGNMYYAVAMCRVHYFRAPFVMPEAGDYKAMAAAWKKYYNTEKGKGSAAEAEKWFALTCMHVR